MRGRAINAAKRGLDRVHQAYGEEVRLLKFIPSATGSIYRQTKRIYEPPLTIRASVSRTPQEVEMGAVGETSERNAELTIPVAYMESLFGDSTSLSQMVNTSDLIVFDNRVWRITQASLTGRVGDNPLLMYIRLREKLGAKEKDYE